MNNEQIKEMLLQIEDTKIDFTVTMSGKESKKVNGLYKPDTHEIILHNLNFKSDNQFKAYQPKKKRPKRKLKGRKLG